MFIDRRKGHPVRNLEWRVRLMGVGAILALVGMYFEASWMIWIAIAVLIGGFLLRFTPPQEGSEGDSEKDGEGSEEEDDDGER